MNKNSTLYMFLFALLICVVCSFLLSFVSESLKDKKELNIALDIKKNILKVVDLKEPLDPKASPDELLAVYDEKIKEIVVDQQGNVIDDKRPADIKEGEEQYPLFMYEENNRTVAYAFPIVGQGLWSTLYGYFSLESDAKTVRGITYYQHGETPGLGGEIDKDWFQDNFKGKSIWDMDKSELVPTAVVKGKVKDSISEDKEQYYVDGISGATMTSKGVTEMIDRELRKYEPYFKKLRK